MLGCCVLAILTAYPLVVRYFSLLLILVVISVSFVCDRVSLELHSAQDVMAYPPVVVRVHESVIRLSELLLNTNHGGFPVVRKGSNGEEVFFGSINRFEICFSHPSFFYRRLTEANLAKVT